MSAVSQGECVGPLVACFVMAGLFVGSLYIWDPKQDRNHPSLIKKRFFSVFIVILVCPFITNLCLTSSNYKNFTIFEILGLRLTGLLPAVVLPLLLTMVLFLGPLCMMEMSELKYLIDKNFWVYNFTNLLWIRNIIIGPLAEEFCFRACMMPLLLQCYKPSTAIFVCSFFFGIAHVHHILERYQAGEEPFKIIIITTLIQFLFTTVFGAYSAFVFFQTGHFISVFILHSFCNAMGFPNFREIFSYENPRKILLIFAHVFGVVLWFLFLQPVLDSKFYDNSVYHSS